MRKNIKHLAQQPTFLYNGSYWRFYCRRMERAPRRQSMELRKRANGENWKFSWLTCQFIFSVGRKVRIHKFRGKSRYLSSEFGPWHAISYLGNILWSIRYLGSCFLMSFVYYLARLFRHWQLKKTPINILYQPKLLFFHIIRGCEASKWVGWTIG